MLYLFCHFISSIKFTWGIISFMKYNKADTEGEGGLKRVVRETSFDGRTQRYHYSTTGQLVLSEGESLVTLWHHDEETELHYNRHRYYDPPQGRYISQEPIVLRGGWNFYVYTLNPIRSIDTLGLAQVCTRPFKGTGGVRTNGMTGLDLGIFHAHIFFDDGTNIGYGGDSGLFSEPKTNDYACNKEKYNDEIMKKAVDIVKIESDNLLFPKGSKQYGNDNYNFIVNNYQDFVSDVLDEYKKIDGAKQ
ncbi:RHS repeat-associated core domain-containing protein [Citrobacter sedlakii]|nr:RHS repeat-associated core domain-containing protein [Citrobacter sedlakii]